MKNIIFLIILILLVSFCTEKQKSNSELLFDKVFNIVRINYIKNDQIDWIEVEKSVRDSIKQFRTDNDVHVAIKYTLDFLKDEHSIFLMPNENIFLIDTFKIPEVQAKIIGKNIGYLKIPGFVANDSLSTLFTLKIRKALKDLDEAYDLLGWIIDLNDNNGGASTLLLGISPLLQDSLIGYQKDNKQNISPVTCFNNFLKIDGKINRSINYDNSLKNRNKKIAILINNKTASSGERMALALSFQGDNSRIFGQKSKGLTTSLMNVSFSPSGAELFFSCEYFCDPDKKVVESVIPDIECSADKSLEKAIEWIKNAI